MGFSYFNLDFLLELMPNPAPLKRLWNDHRERMETAPGSSHNHQAWRGGYHDHIVECLNIAYQLYAGLSGLRPLPFTLGDALVVMYLHDLEKPWKYGETSRNPEECVCGHLRRDHWIDVDPTVKCIVCAQADNSCVSFISPSQLASKEARRKFRNDLIRAYGVKLTPEQENALRYVEGIPDSEYQPGERIMGELAAFCHMCDICSARLWHDKGQWT
jgi:hypothetical protein